MQLQRGFLDSRLWLTVGLVVSAAAVAAYVGSHPIGGRDGSTAVGYGLGGLSALLVLYLALLGIRKRRFRSYRGRRRDVVSAHVYLGLALIFTATLHTGFEFSWSIHTATYVLLLVVIASGIFGIWMYATLPDVISRNLSNLIVEKKRFDASNLEQLEGDIEEIDRRLERAMQFLPDVFRPPVKGSLENTRLGGGLIRILSGSSRRCATARALAQVRDLTERGHFSDEERRRLMDVMRDLARKRELAAGLRRDGRYRALLQIWLWLHVPLTSALLVTMIAHVVLVFFYW